MTGQLDHDVARIIQQLLIDLGGLVVDPDGVTAWPIYVGSMPDAPDNCVSIRDTAGVDQGRNMATGLLAEKLGIQTRIRSVGPVDGYVKAAALHNRMSQNAAGTLPLTNTSVTVIDEVGTASSVYNVISIQHTGPVLRLGPEGTSHRYLWTINSLVTLRKTA